MRYTAIDILKLAGVEKPEDVIGKFSVRIGGVNVNQLDAVINVAEGNTVEVLVGRELTTVELPETPSEEHQANVHAIKEAEGREASARVVDKSPAAPAEEAPTA